VVLIREGRDLLGGLLFAAMLNMKHLFACLAPLYFVYLLRHYCRCGCPLLKDNNFKADVPF
jgi:alpha-1,3-glucosyltransferase